LEEHDAVALLRAAVEREGGQTAFARRHRIDRGTLNRILKGARRLPGSYAKVLRLRKVYVVE
jgi:hypothetical protein